MKQQTLSIIIPAYNEASTIFRLLEKVHHTRLVRDIRKEIIVVNDCSKDNTEEEILRFTGTYPDCTLVYHKQPHNQGKGAAIPAKANQRTAHRCFDCTGNPFYGEKDDYRQYHFHSI